MRSALKTPTAAVSAETRALIKIERCTKVPRRVEADVDSQTEAEKYLDSLDNDQASPYPASRMSLYCSACTSPDLEPRASLDPGARTHASPGVQSPDPSTCVTPDPSGCTSPDPGTHTTASSRRLGCWVFGMVLGWKEDETFAGVVGRYTAVLF
ncbi:hypothetical protein BDP27DRAFT_1427876 [Rhodocollybia butyracea]|uniref:Uncharacterized protein n=1 Tax=Rhodocollybia butyracea TaxID=206335 RepID=A0A9P5U2B8_9AGAR|nr:hypothetical protein BDP27DRAFT_1427876 [Rhodocollybia butyracea]